MKKLFIGLLALSSFSVFANDCSLSVYSQETGKTYLMDFDSARNGFLLRPIEEQLGLKEIVNLTVKTHDHQIIVLGVHTFSNDMEQAGKRITHSLKLSLENGGGAKTSNERFTLGAICSVEFRNH